MGSRWPLYLGPYIIYFYTVHWDGWLKARQHQTQILIHPIALNIAPVSLFLAIWSLPALHILKICTQHLLAIDFENLLSIKDSKVVLPFWGFADTHCATEQHYLES